MGASGRRCHCAVHVAGCQLRLGGRGPDRIFSSRLSVHRCSYLSLQPHILSMSIACHVSVRGTVGSAAETKAGTGSRACPSTPNQTKPNQTTSLLPQACQVLPSTQSVSCRNCSLCTKHPSPLAAHHHRSQSTRRIAERRHLTLKPPFLFLTVIPTTHTNSGEEVCTQRQN
jgi:hypothetical protein